MGTVLKYDDYVGYDNDNNNDDDDDDDDLLPL
jgi:hypothetical protein